MSALTRELARLTPQIMAPDWSAARCSQADPEAWFPPPRSNAGTAAKQVCARCPIQPECLAWAVATGQTHGIWGGKSERERRPLRRHLRGGGSNG